MDDTEEQNNLQHDANTNGSDDNPMPPVSQIDEGGKGEAQFEEPVASPNVVGEENVFSGDAPEGEPADIDEELAKVGLSASNSGEE